MSEPTFDKTSGKRQPRKRPFWLKVLAFGWLCAAAYGWIRFYSSIEQWQWLKYLELVPGPLYFLISGALIGVLGILIIYALWFKKDWAARLILVTSLVLALWFWLDQIIFTVSETARANWPFLLVATILALLYNGVVVYQLKRK